MPYVQNTDASSCILVHKPTDSAIWLRTSTHKYAVREIDTRLCFLMRVSVDQFTHTLQEDITGTGKVMRFSQLQWRHCDGYGKITPMNPPKTDTITTTIILACFIGCWQWSYCNLAPSPRYLGELMSGYTSKYCAWHGIGVCIVAILTHTCKMFFVSVYDISICVFLGIRRFVCIWASITNTSIRRFFLLKTQKIRNASTTC